MFNNRDCPHGNRSSANLSREQSSPQMRGRAQTDSHGAVHIHRTFCLVHGAHCGLVFFDQHVVGENMGWPLISSTSLILSLLNSCPQIKYVSSMFNTSTFNDTLYIGHINIHYIYLCWRQIDAFLVLNPLGKKRKKSFQMVVVKRGVEI
jgi:hypothetical protein